MRKLFIAMLVTLAPLLGSAFGQDLVVTVTFDGGGWFDRSFNEGTWSGLTRAVQELAGETAVDVLIYNGSADTTATALRRMAATRLDLVVAAGFLQADAINETSPEFPGTRFVLIDEVANENPNVRSVLFKDQEGSYLVGYLAGKLSQTGVVGFVGGMDVPLIRNFEQGYVLGVRAACPECRVESQMVGDDFTAWDDPDTARQIATQQAARGADIIFAAAGASGMGVIDFVNETRCYRPNGPTRTTPLTEAVAQAPKDPAYAAACGAGTQPLFFIGVDSNQNYLGDIDGDGLPEVVVGTDSPPWGGEGTTPDYSKSTVWAINGDSTNVSFLAWGWSTPLWLALLATLAAGWVIGFFSGRHHYKGD